MTVSKRRRGLFLVIASLALLIRSEIALELYYRGEALVQVENLGPESVEGLTVINGDERVAFGKVQPGAIAKIYLGGEGTNTLRLEFRQRGNGLTNYELPGFEAAEMYRDGFKLRIRLRPNEVERFQEESEPATPLGRFVQSLWKQIIDRIDSENL